MEKYILDKYDYKKYLLKELPDTRQDELIFWKKTIPMPVDLVYGIFERRGELFSKYLDHIGAAYLFAYSLKSNGQEWRPLLEVQPNKDNKFQKDQLMVMFRHNLEESGVLNLLNELSDTLLLENYRPNEISFVNALCHEGRKYKRLYIAPELRKIISNYFPELLDCISKSNWDMFSNVVADELKIYRMGFADAFSGIFNKLIDFVLEHSNSAKGQVARSSQIKIFQEKVSSNVTNDPVFDVVMDGSIWEPRYIEGRCTYALNNNHPFCDIIKKLNSEAEEILFLLVSSMSDIENETLRDSDKKIIEIFRQQLSRRIRIKMEEKPI